GTSVTPACGAEAHDPERWISEDTAQTKAKARRRYRAVAPRRSAGDGIAVGKAAGQSEPHACPAGAGDQLERRAAASGAASHVAQAARRLTRLRGRAAGRQRKALAVVL